MNINHSLRERYDKGYIRKKISEYKRKNDEIVEYIFKI